MATSWAITPATGVGTSYDFTVGTDDVRDVSEVLDKMFLKDTPLTNRVGFGTPCHTTKIEWAYEKIGKGYVVISNGGDVASNASSFVVGTSGMGAISTAIRYQIVTGTVLKRNESATGPYMAVEDYSIAGSIVFDFFSGHSALITDALTLLIVGSPVNEASTPRGEKALKRTWLSNRTQIFRQDVRISGTQRSVDYHGVPEGELQKRIAEKTAMAKRELETTLILGWYGAGSSTETQTMGGIIYYLDAYGPDNDTTTTTLTQGKINDLNLALYKNGTVPDTLVVGPDQARIIAALEKDLRRTTPDTRVAGYYVNRLMTDLGNELEILVCRWVPKRYALLMSLSDLKVRPLKGRMWNLEKLGKKGDYEEHELIGEMTVEFKGCATGRSAMFSALT